MTGTSVLSLKKAAATLLWLMVRLVWLVLPVHVRESAQQWEMKLRYQRSWKEASVHGVEVELSPGTINRTKTRMMAGLLTVRQSSTLSPLIPG